LRAFQAAAYLETGGVHPREIGPTNLALPIDPDHIAERDLQSLVENGVAEGILFDYKGELYGASDSEKREFLKDVSSFAKPGVTSSLG
jgi:hypothetical protein